MCASFANVQFVLRLGRLFRSAKVAPSANSAIKREAKPIVVFEVHLCPGARCGILHWFPWAWTQATFPVLLDPAA